MSWGIRIVILYLSFVGLILTLVIMSSAQKVDLVSKDYYAQELKYQGKIDAIKNMNEVDSLFKIEKLDDQLRILFPKSKISRSITGKINFFRPSDSALDYYESIVLDSSSRQTIELSKLQKGLYLLQVSFTDGQKEFYKEEPIFVN